MGVERRNVITDWDSCGERKVLNHLFSSHLGQRRRHGWMAKMEKGERLWEVSI
jgi:hypothetical protein